MTRNKIHNRITQAFNKVQQGYSREAIINGLTNDVEDMLKEKWNAALEFAAVWKCEEEWTRRQSILKHKKEIK